MIGDETVELISRFGATSIQHRDSWIVLGGVSCNGAICHENDIVVFSTCGSQIQAVTRLRIPTCEISRPLLVGSSVLLVDDRELVIIGGAATCFSMGTFCRSEISQFPYSSLFFLIPGSGIQPALRRRRPHSPAHTTSYFSTLGGHLRKHNAGCCVSCFIFPSSPRGVVLPTRPS